MKSYTVIYQFSLGIILGAVIACSPTKFTPTALIDSPCKSNESNCVYQNGFINRTETFEIGSGKVDILFVNDNSASMSPIQAKLNEKFSGFIQNLDSKKIDYQIAVTTTDVTAANTNKILPLSNGKSFILSSDADRATLFNDVILRKETLKCETLIIDTFNSFGTNFQYQNSYLNQYATVCPSSDTRGIYTAQMAISDSSNGFVRPDANLSIILISNDDVRQGRYKTDSNYSLDDLDKASNFITSMQEKYPTKYWDFNSIIVKDTNCKAQQVLKTSRGIVVSNEMGPAISGGLGIEYANLSQSAALDIDNKPRPRGQVLDLCQNDYAQHFANMATQITEASRMLNLKCTPTEAPIVTLVGGGSAPYTWNTDKIVFQKGSEGKQVSVSYKCYEGAK